MEAEAKIVTSMLASSEKLPISYFDYFCNCPLTSTDIVPVMEVNRVKVPKRIVRGAIENTTFPSGLAFYSSFS